MVSKPPVLEKAILENLLKEAKQTLGIPDVQDNNEDDPVDPSDSDGSDDLGNFTTTYSKLSLPLVDFKMKLFSWFFRKIKKF